ncbi:Hypothetical predicted protein [Xyrichtys novacula]|uniref:Uncharacterized protein n=1 Tax=Xyrichtys novacula TaxID=13765 RepID=A0AAV1ENV2_XYRNO|nr:Hypothetical predicted protein [Xyrichtys novacula]
MVHLTPSFSWTINLLHRASERAREREREGEISLNNSEALSDLDIWTYLNLEIPDPSPLLNQFQSGPGAGPRRRR